MQGASGGREEEGSKKSIPNIHICLAVLIRGAQNHTQVPKALCQVPFVRACSRVTTTTPATPVITVELQCAELWSMDATAVC